MRLAKIMRTWSVVKKKRKRELSRRQRWVWGFFMSLSLWFRLLTLDSECQLQRAVEEILQCLWNGIILVIFKKRYQYCTNMAAMRNHVERPPLLYQCYKVDKFKNCANCTYLEYQLRATNDELNSAKAIIALLREDLINMNTEKAGQQLTHDPKGTRNNVTCEYDPKGENWTMITRSKGKYQKRGNQTDVEKKTHKITHCTTALSH